jgi:hypothetical protein
MPEESKSKDAAEAVEAIVNKAPTQDIGFLVKCVGISIFFLCLGMCLALVLYGGFSVSATASKKSETITDVKKGALELKDSLPPPELGN